MRFQDLTYLRFGRLVVTGRAPSRNKHTYWHCRCDCGNETDVCATHLTRGLIQSCGCLHSEVISKKCLRVKVGDKYGCLTVVGRHSAVGKKPVLWDCVCDCGNKTVVSTDKLKSGSTKSCGCYHRQATSERSKTHGMSNTRLYAIWLSMRNRCNLKTDKGYRFYGAKGVKVCDEWNRSFEAFYDWAMANGYDPDAPRGECTIDRIDPYGNYEPSNCRWVDIKTQQHNKRSNHTNL